MPEQRTIGADMRSVLATGKGVPWWGAVLIAVTATLIGMAVDAGSGHEELGGIFASFYALGCLAAVLTVRQSGIFTAIVQPPLLLFVTVPLAYYLLHESSFSGVKDIAITCGYPLIERFPLMLFTSSAVLLAGLVRWYLAMRTPQTAAPARPAKAGVLAGLSTKLASASAGNGSGGEALGTRPARPRHVADRSGARRGRRPQDATKTSSRHSRPANGDFADAPPRRRSRRPAMDTERVPEHRRDRPLGDRPLGDRPLGDRPLGDRPQRDRPRGDWQSPPPIPQRDPRERRDFYRDQPPLRSPRSSRLEPYEPGRGYQAHPIYGAYPPPSRQTPSHQPPSHQPRRPSASDRATPDRHPVSQARYRKSAPPDSQGRRR